MGSEVRVVPQGVVLLRTGTISWSHGLRQREGLLYALHCAPKFRNRKYKLRSYFSKGRKKLVGLPLGKRISMTVEEALGGIHS